MADMPHGNFEIKGEISGSNVKIGGTQNFFGPVNLYGSSGQDKSANRKVRLFISYARKDDEPFTERL